MWVEFGDASIVNIRKFASFLLRHYEEESIIYGVTNGGAQATCIAGAKDEVIAHFEKLRVKTRAETDFRELFFEHPAPVTHRME